MNELARSFLESYRAHMKKEEKVFFPVALGALKPKNWRKIESRESEGEDPRFGDAAEERFVKLRGDILTWGRSNWMA